MLTQQKMIRVTNLPLWPPPADGSRQMPAVSTSPGNSWAVGEVFVGSAPSWHMVEMQKGFRGLRHQEPQGTAWTGLRSAVGSLTPIF